MRLDTIAAYTYAADIYCPDCIIGALKTGEARPYDGWALVHPVTMPVEDNLDEIALAFGIDRMNEHTFDSDDFPKVVLGQMIDPYAVYVCGGCFVNFLDEA